MADRLKAAVLCGSLVLGVVACGRGDGTRADTAPSRATAPLSARAAKPADKIDLRGHALLIATEERLAPPEAPPQVAAAADALVGNLALYDAPGAPQPSRVLANPTVEGVPLVVLVLEDAGDWLRVQVPARPNNTSAWVRASEVSVRLVPNRVVIELAARRITAYDFDGNVLLAEPVAVGQDRYPTPVGSFFVDSHFVAPGGAYGAYMVSVAAYSDVLPTFGGGVGQIAIHGTNQPGLIGQNVSHGCVRMTNEAVTRLASLAGTGTPVTILP